MKISYSSLALSLLLPAWALAAQTTSAPVPAMEKVFLHFQGELPAGMTFDTTVDSSAPPPASIGRGRAAMAGATPTLANGPVTAKVMSAVKSGDGYRVQCQVTCAVAYIEPEGMPSSAVNYRPIGYSGVIWLKPNAPLHVALGEGFDITLTLSL